MALTTETAGAFVSRAFPGPGTETRTRVELLRPICIGGVRVEPGEIEVERSLAAFLVGAGKARRIPEKQPAPPADEPPAQTRARRPRAQE